MNEYDLPCDVKWLKLGIMLIGGLSRSAFSGSISINSDATILIDQRSIRSDGFVKRSQKERRDTRNPIAETPSDTSFSFMQFPSRRHLRSSQ
jgi:hypothetical protein